VGRVWDAEIVVDAETAGWLIREQFPELEITSVEPFGVGFDNTAFLVGSQYVFRFPRRQIAVDLLESEIAFLSTAESQELPLSVPRPQWIGMPSQHYQWPFLGYEKLEGSTADRAELSDEDRAQLASALGSFLAKLHALPVDRYSFLTGDRIGKLDLQKRIPLASENLAELKALNLIDGFECFEAIVAETAQMTSISTIDCVVHGDVYARHLLVNHNRKICGVIDWGDVHIGNRAVDLAVMYSFLPRNAYEDFMRAYGNVDDDTMKLARFRALYVSCILVQYGIDCSDEELVQEGKRALRYIAEQDSRY
jgi:aminoglycoside phosphotransferase (APT) family kinase protein